MKFGLSPIHWWCVIGMTWIKQGWAAHQSIKVVCMVTLIQLDHFSYLNTVKILYYNVNYKLFT